MNFRLFQAKVEASLLNEKFLGQNAGFRDRNFSEISTDIYIKIKRPYLYGLLTVKFLFAFYNFKGLNAFACYNSDGI